MKPAITLVLLAALAALINQFAPTVFFDMQLMLGGSIAVFALLQFGWAGLLVGITALGVTALRWGHPFELMIGTLFLVWLKTFLDRFNGGREHQDNGRIVLAAIAFWLTAGIGLEVAVFHFRFGVETTQALVLAFKEAATGMINVTLGLLLYIVTGATGFRKTDTTVPVRGAVSVVVLLAITVPAISLSSISTRQLQRASIEAYRLELKQKAYALVHVEPGRSGRPDDEPLDFLIQQPDGRLTSSNPALIDKLNHDYTKFETNRSGVPGLDFYAPNVSMAVIEEDLLSYWSVTFTHHEKGHDKAPQVITLFQPANVLFEKLDRSLLLPVFALIFALFVVGGLTGEILGWMVQRQFKQVLSLQDQETLGTSRIRELHQLSREINTRERQVHKLNDALAKTRQTAFDLTENIPVGTYTMVQPPDGGMASFSFMSTRFLELTGLEREEARSDPMKAFACVHPDDRDEWVRKNIEVFEKKLPFREECRVIVKDEIRWIIAESRPRDLEDGSVVWEGVLADITDRKLAEQKLALAYGNMRMAASATKLGFWDYDVNTGVDQWDENMCRIHGLSPDEFDGDWKKYVHPEDYDEVMHQTRQMLERDELFSMDYRIVRKDGEARYVREHGMVIRDKFGRATRAHGTMFDITDETMTAERERQLEIAHRENLESKLKSSLTAAAIGHEINTPLSTLLLQSKQSLKQGFATSEELNLMALEAERVLRIIEKMKVLMRNVQTEHFPVNLREVLDSSLLQVKRDLISHDIHVAVRTKPELANFTVPGDDAQIQLALTNILRNAVEAIVEDEEDRPREILVELQHVQESVRITIGDSGPGWSGAQLEELPLNTTKEGGTGIGLYIIRTTVHNHHAHLAFGESPLGGAEISITFPAS
ncbi:MAG: PAS domain-containing sensor histidine kinase [Kiritimatiellia bacterium]